MGRLLLVGINSMLPAARSQQPLRNNRSGPMAVTDCGVLCRALPLMQMETWPSAMPHPAPQFTLEFVTRDVLRLIRQMISARVKPRCSVVSVHKQPTGGAITA